MPLGIAFELPRRYLGEKHPRLAGDIHQALRRVWSTVFTALGLRGDRRQSRPATRAPSMAALVVSRHEPHMRAFYLQLLVRGKPKMQALVAVMRKLLHNIFGMFKHDPLFDGAKVCPQVPTSPLRGSHELKLNSPFTTKRESAF